MNLSYWISPNSLSLTTNFNLMSIKVSAHIISPPNGFQFKAIQPSKNITILYRITELLHIIYYLLAKEEMQMAFGAADVDDCRPRNRFGEGIAIVVVIILLLIALGIVF